MNTRRRWSGFVVSVRAVEGEDMAWKVFSLSLNKGINISRIKGKDQQLKIKYHKHMFDILVLSWSNKNKWFDEAIICHCSFSKYES